MIPNDTHPDAERVQIELLRKMSPERRARMASRLTNQVRWRARQGVARAHPGLTHAERELLLIEANYGRELASRVRTHLDRIAREHAR